MFVTVARVLGQIEGGQLKLLAYTDDNYADSAPEAPTMAEDGVEGIAGRADLLGPLRTAGAA